MRKLIPVFLTVSLAYLRYLVGKRNSTQSRTLIVVFAMFCAFCSVAPTPAYAQSSYTDSTGIFSVMVPANWQTQRDPGSHIVSFINEKSYASVSMGVILENAATTPTADKELEMVQAKFPGNCPQAKIQKRGPATLVGIRGAFLLVNCTNSKGGLEVMKFVVASKPGMLLVFNSASPAPIYKAVLPALNSMEHSFKLLASTGNRTPDPARKPPGQSAILHSGAIRLRNIPRSPRPLLAHRS